MRQGWTKNFGSFWYLEPAYFRYRQPYENLQHHIQKVIKNKQEVFIEHYYDNYKTPPYPPLWMIMETLSFGMCSKLFANLKHVNNKKKIARIFYQAPTLMDSWLETLVYTRNICAHHARLWNRWFVTAPMIPKQEKYHDRLHQSNRKFIAIAYIISTLLKEIAPKSHWKNYLFKLFKKYSVYPGKDMGFYEDWQTDPFWQ